MINSTTVDDKREKAAKVDVSNDLRLQSVSLALGLRPMAGRQKNAWTTHMQVDCCVRIHADSARTQTHAAVRHWPPYLQL